MGLKLDIYKAFEKNLKYIDNDGKEVNPLDESNKGKAKVEELSKDLSLAIKDFIVAQTFTITKLNASQVAVPSTPAAVPMITVKVDENNLAPDNPKSGLESSQSEVKLKRAVEV